MTNALMISIGNELLNGKTLNSNATFLGRNLTNLGFRVLKIVTIPDDEIMVSSEISQAINSTQFRIIIITGGLGPTWDDSTSLFLAHALNIGTELNHEALNIVTKQYQTLYEKNLVDSPEITPARKKMAIFPIGAEPINNTVGTAPGIFFNHKESNTWIFCLPGVPREMEEMYQLIEPKLIELTARYDIGYYELEITTSFSDESLLAPFLNQVRQKFDVWIKSFPHTYQEEKNIRLIISKLSNSKTSAKQVVLNARNYLIELIGQ